MKQLKMIWRRQTPLQFPLPKGFKIRSLNLCDEDIEAWLNICKNGLIDQNADKSVFKAKMLDHPDLKPDDILIVEKDGTGVATIAAITHQNGQGYIHMVAAKPECRGLGIGHAMNYYALKRLYDNGCTTALLTTDEFRVPAIKSYLKAGFLPVDYDEGMIERWEKLLVELKIEDVEMVDENAKTLRILNQKFFCSHE